MAMCFFGTFGWYVACCHAFARADKKIRSCPALGAQLVAFTGIDRPVVPKVLVFTGEAPVMAPEVMVFI